jgi:DNA-binding transcriptional ArsR family regulator
MTEQEKIPELLDFFRALADENRLKIVGFLAQKPSSVTDLAQALGLSVSTTSNHLSSLAYAGLVKARGALLYLLAANGDD